MKTLTREELYELVWSKPISKIAPRYGLSDRGLGKICERHGIPVPPRGFWAKKAAGKSVGKRPLSGRTSGQPDTITLPQPKPTSAVVADTEVLAPEIAFERQPENRIAVDSNAKVTHPLVRAAAAELRSRKADYDGFVWSGRECVDIRVTPSSVARALRLMQSLLLAMERRGYSVTVSVGKTSASVLGESVGIYLRERTRRRIRALTADEQRRRREGFHVSPYHFAPSTELALYVNGATSRPVADTEKRPLEDGLNQFIEAVVRDALRQRAWRVERQCEEERYQEAERRRAKRARVRREDEARAARFNGLVSAWENARRGRRFLAALKKSIGTVDIGSELGRWLEWAHHFVEATDPISRFAERGRTVTVYYAAYGSEIAKLKSGAPFVEPAFSEYDRNPPPPGIPLSDSRPAGNWMTEALELELPEDLLLPHEVTEPGYIPRRFFVPARILNAHRDRAQGGSHDGENGE